MWILLGTVWAGENVLDNLVQLPRYSFIGSAARHPAAASRPRACGTQNRGRSEMTRQHTPLVLVEPTSGSRILAPVSLSASTQTGGYDEAWLQDLIFTHPHAMPIDELDPAYGPLIPICKELDTRAAGYIDALFMNRLGMLTLVECKLWRSPEARREVVGQILDYARTLKKWSFSDLQREVARARKEQNFDLVAHVYNASGRSNFDEAAFVDNVTRNLQKGRALLLVIGDGIREGVEAIAEYLQATTSLQFTFGLVEAQAFELAHKSWVVQSRVLARTLIINRTIVDVAASGLDVSEEIPPITAQQLDERQKWMLGFWTELIDLLKLDDRAQPSAKPLAGANIFFPLPTRGNLWITCYFNSARNQAGVFLGYSKTSQPAVEVVNRIEVERDPISSEFEESGLRLSWDHRSDGKLEVGTSTQFPGIRDDQYREKELRWFSVAINTFVNVFRPRVTAGWEELTSG